MKSKKKLLWCTAAIAVLTAGGASAQSINRIDELLRQDPATNGHGAYLVLTAAGVIDEELSPAAAFSRAQEAGLFRDQDESDGDLTFGRLSYLLMESFGVSGGVMYRVFPGPRYAAREVVYQRWSRTRRAPRQRIDGETVMRVVSVYLNAAAQSGGAP